MMEPSDDEAHGERVKWARKFEYLLSVLGFIVGFGNVWRFPYICMINGGGAFLIPYLFFLVMCGVPVFFIESILGQFTAKPVTKVWGICPLFGGIGYGMTVLQLNVTLYYNNLLGWILYYMYCSFKSPLPWSSCDNSWNTEQCRMKRTQSSTLNNSMVSFNSSNNAYLYNMTYSNNTSNESYSSVSSNRSPAEEFWRYQVLQISPGITDLGYLVDHTSVTTLISYVIVFFCLIRGIKSVGKAVYVTATLPYVLLIIILIKGLTLPGAWEGVRYFLEPDFSKLLTMKVWVQAGVQVFYSLGPGWGCLITMASFNKFNNNCLRDSVTMALAGEGTSIFSGLVIFTILGFMSHQANVPVSEVVQSGPGLGFIAYPEALAQLPLPNIWVFLFFLAMLTVGLDSHFAIIESMLDSLMEANPVLKRRPMIVRVVFLSTVYVVSLVFCTQGGMYLYQVADWYIASVANFVFAISECLIVGWIYGADRFSKDVDLMIGRKPPYFMKICWCFITPIILLSLLMFLFATYQAPHYGSYEYPWWTEVIGWLFAFTPIVPIIVVAIRVVVQAPGETWKKKLQHSLKPSEDWRPASDIAREDYCHDRSDEQKLSMLKKFKS